MDTATQESPRATTKPRRPRIEVRIAGPDDAVTVSRLVSEAGFAVLDDLDFSDLYPNWLVAEVDGMVMATVQVLPARPIGYIEYLAADEDLDRKTHTRVLKKLTLSAFVTLKKAGAQMAGFIIPFELKSFKNVIKRRGAVVLASGNFMAVRI